MKQDHIETMPQECHWKEAEGDKVDTAATNPIAALQAIQYPSRGVIAAQVYKLKIIDSL